MEALISVIIPVYNVEKYLRQCIESVIDQSYHNLEIILIDDGSTDESGKLCNIYAKTDNRIKVIHPENCGVSGARNTGLQYATGEYIAFVDSDDIIEKQMLEKCIYEMQEEQLDFVYFNIVCKAEHGEPYPDMPVKQGTTEICSMEQRMQVILDDFLGYKMKFSVWNKLYRRNFLVNHHIRFDEGIWIAEDLAFNLKCLMYANKIKGIPDVLYQYWRREGSAITSTDKVFFQLDDYSRFLEKVEEFYINGGFSSSDFGKIFIKTMDNLYRQRKRRSDFKPFVNQVQDKAYLKWRTLDAIVHPLRFVSLFRMRDAVRKWLDYVYMMAYLVQ